MSQGELEVLGRAHRLFAGAIPAVTLTSAHDDGPVPRTATFAGYERAVRNSRAALRSAADIDAAVADVVATAHRDHLAAHHQTKRVLDEARTEPVTSNAPLAQREAMRRRVAR